MHGVITTIILLFTAVLQFKRTYRFKFDCLCLSVLLL
jgi:hypothetical protein